MYGKLFESMYEGTLAENWEALVTFQQMIILCDADGVIDITPSALARRTGIPITHIKAGIKILEADDPDSRTRDHGGKRIMRLDEHRSWGWFIVNHEKYKNLKDAETKREQARERKRRQREREREKVSQGVTQGHAPSSMSPHIDKNKNIKHSSDSGEPDMFDKFWEGYPRKESKKKARSVFKRLTKKNQQLAIDDSSTRYADTQKKYIPLPTTYLNGERWTDEIEPPNDDDSPKRSDREWQTIAAELGIEAWQPGISWPAWKARVEAAEQRRAEVAQ